MLDRLRRAQCKTIDLFILHFEFSSHLKNKHAEEFAIYSNSDEAKQQKAFDQDIANRYLARFVAASTVSFRQSASPEFDQFVNYLNPVYHLPSRQTVTNYVKKEASRAIEVIRKLLASAPMVLFKLLFIFKMS